MTHLLATLVPLAVTLGAFTFVSPCAYPLLPGYVSFYLGTGDGTATDGGTPADPGTAAGLAGRLPFVPAATAARVGRAVVIGTVVSAGFFLVFGAMGGVVVLAGQQLLANVAVMELVVGVVLVVLGLAMAAGVDLPQAHVELPERQRSLGGYFAFGVLYAAAAAGCSAPLFLGVSLRAIAAGPVTGALTLGAYAAGMSLLMIGVTVTAALGREVLLRTINEHMGLVQRIGGGLLVVAGTYEVYLYLFRYGGLETLGLA